MWKVRGVTELLLIAALLSSSRCHGFFQSFSPSKEANSNAPKKDASFVGPNTEAILEEACIDTANRMNRVLVPVSKEVSSSEEVGISYVHWPAEGNNKNKKAAPPLVLVHGFDSSCLEYRRLGSKLAARGIDTYAVDILGWGYTKLQNDGGDDDDDESNSGSSDDPIDFSANSKVEALNSFVGEVIGENRGFCIGGASLGGAAAIELAAMSGDNCEGLVLIDAQGFVDGVGPMAALPRPLAQLGVQVLKSVPLRSSANQMSYFDKERFATDDALAIGRLHTLRDGWSDAMVSFMKSGGFSPSQKVPTMRAPALVLWGRDDGILDGNEFANKFLETLPNARLRWIEECGHVPHLEQPEETAAAIAEFVLESAAAGDGDNETTPPVVSLMEKLFKM